ncbi:MAG: Uma2 family endonuclease [Microcoleaceae cyanobacterium]
MTFITSKSLTLTEFLEQYGDNPRYELIDGELRDLEPTGPHESVAGTISGYIFIEIIRSQQPWVIPKNCLIQPPAAEATALRPDVIVLDKNQLQIEPLWQREPIICNGSSIKLVVEVVSTNWQDDYARKVEEYAFLGIPEYWIVDYRGLGGIAFIGKPKQPTFTVFQLIDEEYTQKQYRQNQLIQSGLFPNIKLCLNDLIT